MNSDRISKLIRVGLASEVQMDELGFDGVIQAKSTGPQVLTNSADIRPGSYRFLLSTEAPDRRGDVVRQAGLDLRNYRKNNVVLLNHDSENLPIGTSTLVLDGKQTWMDVTFSEANPMARVVRGMTDEGTLKAASISILPKKVDPVRSREKREEMGLGKYGVVYEASEVLEGSIVTLPMNADAVRSGLKVGVEKGLFSADDASAFERVAQPTERDLFNRVPVSLSMGGCTPQDAPEWLERPDNLTARVERAVAALAVKQAALARDDDGHGAAPSGGAARRIDVSRLSALVAQHLKEQR